MHIALSIVYILASVVNNLHHKHTIDKHGVATQVPVKFLFSAIFSSLFFLFFSFNINFTPISILILIFSLFLNVFITIYTNKMISGIDMFVFMLIIKLEVPIKYIIDVFLGLEKLSLYIILGILILLIGSFLLVWKGDKNLTSKVSSIKISLVFIALILRSYLVYFGVNNNYFNEQTFAFLWFLSVGVITFFIYKEDIKFSLEVFKDYAFQSFFNVVLNLAYYLLLTISVFQLSVLDTFRTVFIIMLSPIFLKANLNKKDIIASLFILLGFLIINYF